ncbi:MAG: hypothetical protein AAF750_05255 [Planctomycetota bacterium]
MAFRVKTTDWGLILAGVVLLSAACVGVLGPSDGTVSEGAERAEYIEPGAAATQPLPQLVGFTINMHHPYDVTPAIEAIDELHRLGFNALQLTVPVFQEHGSSPVPVRDIRPSRSPSDEQILAVLRHAKSYGMHTNLLWQINFTAPRGNEWRGKIRPPDWGVWWTAYYGLLGEHADLARRAGADVFTIGCELLSTHAPEFRQQWLKAVAEARKRFPGRIVYSSTWDSFEKYPAWDGLDVVGVSGWWNLTRGAADPENPTDAELKGRWVQIKKGLLAFAERQGRPLLITEVGYPTIPWALRDPWNYIPRSDTVPDAEAQARGYASFTAAWADTIAPPGLASRSDDFLGVFFYEWSPFMSSGTPNDFGYSPRNKPAEAIVTQWIVRDLESRDEDE